MRSRRAGYLTCVAVFAAACTIIAGCSSGGGTGSAAAGTTSGSSSGKITIGLSLLSAENPFYNGIAAGIKDAAKSMNVDLQTSFASNSISTQATQIESFVARGVDGILTSPGDPTSLLAAYKEAMDKKVPIMSVANDISDTSNETAFIGADWGTYGKQIAEWTCQHFTGQSGEIAMIVGPAGLSYVQQMTKPYKDYMTQSCPKLKVVFSQNLPDETVANALPVAQQALAAHPNISVIFGGNDSDAAGAIQALQKAGKIGKVMVTGFDGDPIGLQNVQKGLQAMTISLNPHAWGELALKTMVDAIHGQLPANHLVPIQTTLLDKSNIADFCSKNKC